MFTTIPAAYAPSGVAGSTFSEQTFNAFVGGVTLICVAAAIIWGGSALMAKYRKSGRSA